MKTFKINALTNVFHQLSYKYDPRRTVFCNDLIQNKTVDYLAKDSREGKNVLRQFFIEKVTDAFVSKKGEFCLAVDVIDRKVKRSITLRANRIEKINGEDADVVKVYPMD